MVTVTDYNKHLTKDGRDFITLELTGGLEFIQSSTTGKQYATVRKCTIPSTFEENIAKSLIGTQLDGNIVKVPCDPYEYVKKSTGELMILDYSYGYQSAPDAETIGSSQVKDMEFA